MSVLAGLLLVACAVFYRHWTATRTPRIKAWHVATVDGQFGISKDDLERAAEEAAALWEQGAGRPMFRHVPRQGIAIHLRYDHRQEAVDKLKHMGSNLSSSRDVYDAMKERVEGARKELDAQQGAFHADREAYHRDLKQLEAEAKGGGAVPGLRERHQALEMRRAQLEQRREDLARTANAFNAEVEVLNDLARSHNLDVIQTREVGETLGDEYAAGLYQRDGLRESITLSVVHNRKALVRILAHELGHALGIKHVPDPEALMHSHTRHDRLELRPQDVEALKQAHP